MYVPSIVFIIAGIVVFIYIFGKRQDFKNYEYIPHMRRLLDLMGWEQEFNEYWKKNRNLSEYKALKNYFTRSRLSEALEMERKSNETQKYHEEERKRAYTLDRIYAYQYENFVFSLFAPLAVFNEYENKWELTPFLNSTDERATNIIKLPEKYVIHKIASEYQLSDREALNRFNEFCSKHLLHYNNVGHWCELGLILEEYPNIVSANDMNLTKWIEKYGQPVSREQRLEEIRPYMID